jgi:hypothetical protein
MNTPTGSQPPDPRSRTDAPVADSVGDGRSNPSQPPAAPTQGPPDDPATGHYGPGYGDPKRHYGNDPPPRSSSNERPPPPPDDDPAAR